MPTNKPPTIKLGEYGPVRQVEWSEVERFTGTYSVELGAEHKTNPTLPKKTFRMARVNGHLVSFYAMIHGKGVSDMSIERNETELERRAIAIHVADTLLPAAEEQDRIQAKASRLRAMISGDEWRVEETFSHIVIMPLGITLPKYHGNMMTQKDAVYNDGLQAVMARIVALVKEHGLGRSEPHVVSAPDPVAGEAYWNRRNALTPVKK